MSESKETDFIHANNGNVPNEGDNQVESDSLLRSGEVSGEENESAPAPINSPKKKEFKEEPEDDPAPSISYLTLFRYASTKDRILIAIALTSTSIAGCVTPFNTIVFANMLNSMVTYGLTMGWNPNAGDIFMQEIQWFFIWNVLCGVVILIFVYIATLLMNQTAFNQVFIIRQEYLKSALNQDFSWYDLHESGDFASKMTEDLVKLEDGINEKMASFIYYMAAFLSSVIMALVKGWKMALVCLCSFPITLGLVGSMGFVASRLAKQEAVAYGRAASVAEEVLSAVRTVYAFGGQDKEASRFGENLSDAKKINIKRSFFSACMLGLLFFCIYGSYALSFWYGVRLLQDPNDNYDVSNMMAVFFGVMMGSMNFGMSTPLIEVFGVARGAGAQVFRLIDNVPQIDALRDRGARPAAVRGNLRLTDLHFAYPSRPDVPVLKGVNLTVERGQTVALVGASGCGKSTIIQLLSRFYDPAQGSVELDGVDVRTLSVSWLRDQIGLVGQEPVLFNATVGENVRYGREDATRADVEAAARAANAHGFISKLPQGYDTLVGDRGTQLSGGQKQRIAIARALVREPAILLLDEATSALDNASEAVVQAALDKARQGRTTVIVAHRLSTIRSADVIYVFRDGGVVEAGSHRELMELRGVYHDMVGLQTAPADLFAGAPASLEHQESVDSVKSSTSDTATAGPLALDKEEKNEEVTRSVSFLEVLGYSKPEWPINTLACICSLCMGFGMPLFSILFGDFIGNLSESDPAVVASQTNTLSMMFLILGILIGIFTFFQTFLFGVAGEKLTERMRQLMFTALLRQEVGFYDDKLNSTGALCARLSGDASLVQGATGLRIGTVMQGIGSLGLGTAVGLYFEWRVGLFILALSPLMVTLVYQSNRMSHQQAVGAAKTMQDSTKLAVDAVSNVRTVASLGRQRVFVAAYRAQLEPGLALARRGAHVRGLVYAASRAIMNFAFAAAVYYGSHLIVTDGVEYANILKSTQALIMSTSSIGNMFAFAPNFEKGVSAAGRIINLLERVPRILDPVKPEKEVFNATGDAALVDVHFSYPSRPTVAVLRGLGLAVRRGATVALVGASGCGKSTAIQLLQRFYEPAAGEVYLDNLPLRSLLVSEVRRNIGLVQQEPVLFDRTIAENIAYGDNAREPPMREVVQAARQANIHNFIVSLPLGYETRLGSKGTQLSGGQKQRIAIARALIRNPKILLLDEATSALDAESEKVVQEALDAAKEGRTCITIAHRLTTIQDADVICVLHQGRVGEMGSHAQLLAKRGLYYKLYQSNYS